jgi:gliding motility-associated-like protein
VGQSATGCDSVVIVSVVINPDFNADITAVALLCNAPNTGSLIINNAGGGTGNIMVAVDNGNLQNYSPGISFSNLAQGQHTVRIIDQNGCDSTITIQINNSALLTLRLPNDTIIKRGVSVDIPAQINFNPGNIVWTPPDFLSCNGCLNPRSTPDNTITYTLMVEDQNGCKVEDQITITVIVDQADVYLPNVFSPNHDQINDTFAPIFKFPAKTRISFFRIFDRWGEQVFEKTNGLVGEIFEWNGEFKSKNVLPGVYVYHIQYVGEDNIPRDKAGEVTVLQ